MKYKFILLFFGIAGLFALLSFNALSSKQASKSCPKINPVSQTVLMKKDSFEPETLTIQKCTQVVFRNEDKNPHWPASNLHPTHGIYPEFDPQQPIESDNEWSFVFDKVGSWRYHDHIAPSTRGNVIVE